MSYVTGVHHIALKCENEEMFQKTLTFYSEIIGLETVRSWGEGAGAGAMLAVGDSLFEIFATGRVVDLSGTIHHVALAVTDVDALTEKIRAAGYRITMEPKDIVIASAKPLAARIAFCIGPVGEEIELFCEK